MVYLTHFSSLFAFWIDWYSAVGYSPVKQAMHNSLRLPAL